MEVLNLVGKMTSSNWQNLEGFLSGVIWGRLLRQYSGTNDRFPRRSPEVQPSWRGTGACSPGDLFLDFNSPKSPFLNFWVIQTRYLLTVQTIFQISTLKVLSFTKNIYMKNLTDFRKTEENGMDPRLILISKTGHQKIPFTLKELEFKKFHHGYF